ncbi:uncharacterized protein C8Q71DRAFT_907021 [Rhodofomes roseus]|uniref:Homeobox domain-containing protein n=1 Tax=Rhodofomes roseus TaxID=34475 RepID=A0ABQ8KGT8_9APHY|nr:uncharacterized protein C8Q71DRAFT_907021 [Rhodofomes roseus]KAH9836954.1 hypothetical protein C8Q71DRAFT_907021 [Rhodofomes roseus]
MPVERTGSVLSCSSVDSSSIDSVSDVPATPKSNKPVGEIPFVRRRLQHEQTVVLSAIFEYQTHPSKDVRTALAEELGIELKTVSAWFQNKRRSVKKKSLVWTRPSQENQYEGIAYPAYPRKRHLTRSESAISLDCVVSARERRVTPEPASPTRPPLTPRRINAIRRYASPSRAPPTNIWEHIPSSPPVAPSSPSADSVRFSALPRRTKSLRSLEWACAKARGNKIPHPDVLDEEDCDVPMLVLDGEARGAGADGDDTETEEYEAITPDVSAVHLDGLQSPTVSLPSKRDDDVAPAQDMEAAMALLGFMGRPSL